MPTKRLNEAWRKTGENVRNRAENLRVQTNLAIRKQGIGLIVALIMLFSVGLIFLFVNIDTFYNVVVLKYGLLGLFIVAVITDLTIMPVGVDIPLMIAFIIPGINDLAAFLVVMLGVVTAVVIGYFVGKRWGVAGMEAMVGKKRFEKFSKNRKWGKFYMFISALTPLPYLPYLAGIYNLSWKECFHYLVFPKGLRYLFYWGIIYLFGTAILGWV